jgi:hypothetical protein
MKQLEHRGGVVIEFEDLRLATTPLPLCGCSSDESTKTNLGQCIPTDSGLSPNLAITALMVLPNHPSDYSARSVADTSCLWTQRAARAGARPADQRD